MNVSLTQRASTAYRLYRPYSSVGVVVALVFGVQMCAALGQQGLPVLYPFIQADLALSRAQVGLITSFVSGAGVTTAILGGWLTDIFGVKKVIVLSLLATGVFMVAFPLAVSFPLVLALAALSGIAEGPVFPAGTKAIIDWLPARVRGLGMSVKQSSVPVGGTVAAAVLPFLALAAGWRTAAAAIGVVMLLTAIIFLFRYKDKTRGQKAAAVLSLSALRSICTSRPIVVATVWGALFSTLHFTLISYIILFAIEDVGMPTVVASGLLAAVQLTAVFGRIAWGAISDFFFKGRRVLVLFIIGLIACAGLTALSFMDRAASAGTMFLLAVIMGASIVAWPGVFTTLIGEIADPRQIATTVGFASTGQKLAVIFVPPLFGYLADVTGTYYLGWRVAAAMALCSSVALLIFCRDPQRR